MKHVSDDRTNPRHDPRELTPVMKSQFTALCGTVFWLVLCLAFIRGEDERIFVLEVFAAIILWLLLAGTSGFWFYARTLPKGRESARANFKIAVGALIRTGRHRVYAD